MRYGLLFLSVGFFSFAAQAGLATNGKKKTPAVATAFVHTIDSKTAEKILGDVDKIATVRKRIWSLLVVEKQKDWKATESKLLKIPGVVRISDDVPVEWKAEGLNLNDALQCLERGELNTLGIKSLGELLSRLNGSCRTTPACADMGWPTLWAQRTVDADLMMDVFSSLSPASVTTKGAIVDSGFDSTVLNERFRKSPTYFFHGKKVDTSNDPGNHGTSGMSLIGAESIFPMPEGIELTGFSSNDSLANAFGALSGAMEGLKTACESGAEVINASFGDATDELQGKRDEVVFKEFLNEMADHGCLIVKAAGNAGNKKVYDSDDPDDALLRVGAIGYSSQEAGFSSHGEINAPGEAVFGFRSSQDENFLKGMAGLKNDGNACNEKMGAIISGTSFSAPITSAIAIRTLHLLKRSKQFTALPGKERVKLLNRVLRASSQGSAVNALRAAELALAVANQDLKEVPSVEQLQDTLKARTAEECKNVKPCDFPNGCDQAASCEKKLRRQTALCDSQLTNDDFELMLANQSYDLLLNKFAPTTEQAEKVLKSALASNPKTFARVLAGLISNGTFAKIATPQLREEAKEMTRSLLAERSLPMYEADMLFASLAKEKLFSLDLYSKQPKKKDAGIEQDNAFLRQLNKNPDLLIGLKSEADLNAVYQIYNTTVAQFESTWFKSDRRLESKYYDASVDLVFLKLLPQIEQGEPLLRKIAARDKSPRGEIAMLVGHYSKYPTPQNRKLLEELLDKKAKDSDYDASITKFLLMTVNVKNYFSLPEFVFQDYGPLLLKSKNEDALDTYLDALQSQMRYFPAEWEKQYLSAALQSPDIKANQLQRLVRGFILAEEYDPVSLSATFSGPPPKLMPAKVRSDLFAQIAAASEHMKNSEYDYFWSGVYKTVVSPDLLGRVNPDWRQSFEKKYGFPFSDIEPLFRKALASGKLYNFSKDEIEKGLNNETK